MAKYRGKQIEAFKYDGDFMNSKGEFYIPDWAIKAYKEGTLYFASDNPEETPELFIKFPDGGVHRVLVGSYIIKDINNIIISHLPEVFEKNYEEAVEMMRFEEILPLIKTGKKARRKGWNGANQWVKRIDSRCWKIEPSVIGDYAESDILVLKNAQDKVFAWIPSLGDIFAEDWEVVE